MPQPNSSQQNLRGQSFKGQHLSDADFSNADLRGVDFSGATLTRVKFCRARLGRSGAMTVGIMVRQLLLACLAGILAAMGGSFMFFAIQLILKTVHSNTDTHALIGVAVFSLSYLGVLYISLMRQQWAYVLAFYSIIILMAIAGAGAGVAATAIVVSVAVAVAVAVGVAVAVAVGVAVAGAIAGAVAVAVAVAEGGFLAVAIVGAEVGAEAGAVATAAVIFIVFGIYLGYRASRKEEPQLLFLRHLGLAFSTLGGTQFAHATLIDCDFSAADLKYARFKQATLQGCTFKHAKNSHLALTRDTPLEFKKVRELVETGKLTDSDFADLNLQGLDFSGLGLTNVNFARSNLSFANFSHADLRGADLTETTAIATRFSQCQLTGACIGHWNIDKRTQLEQIDCQYVYLKADHSDRNPIQGEFIVGEFSKLYQQIADTLDFVAHNRDQYEAIINAINTIKGQSCAGLYVQALERKDEAIVIRAKAPPEFDRNEVYAQIQQEYQVQIKLLEAQHQQALLLKDVDYLQRENALKTKHEDLLAEVLKATVSQPVTIYNEVGKTVQDQSRKIINSPISHAAVNLGDYSTVTASIDAMPDSSGELQALLRLLQDQISASAINDDDKHQAGQQVQAVAAAASTPLENQLAVVKNVSRWFKGFVEDIKDWPETAAQLGETVAKIAVLVGL